VSLLRAGAPFVNEVCARALRRKHGNAFELLGLDILVDRSLRPWLLECNLEPSLAAEDAQAKVRLVRALLRLIGVLDPVGEENGFRRIC